jgi:glycerophosphoryl diester phosphodiesterase
MSYGGDEPERALAHALPGMRVMSRKSLRDCGLNYLAYGWTGYVPQACRNTIVLVPLNYGWMLWGWPNRFVERMHAVRTEVYVIGPYSAGDPGSTGVDTLEQANALPDGFPGGVWTNRVDRVGPVVKPGR